MILIYLFSCVFSFITPKGLIFYNSLIGSYLLILFPLVLAEPYQGAPWMNRTIKRVTEYPRQVANVSARSCGCIFPFAFQGRIFQGCSTNFDMGEIIFYKMFLNIHRLCSKK